MIPSGLSEREAALVLERVGPNQLRRRGWVLLDILGRQLGNPVLLLLAAVAVLSIVLGQRTDATIVLGIVLLSVGLGTLNEYRASTVIRDLQARIRHETTVIRDGVARRIDASLIVPGDAVRVELGDVIPADMRLVAVENAACNEATLTGESLPSEKRENDFAFMGTILVAGRAIGIVSNTGMRTQLGQFAAQLRHLPPVTAFEKGLREFSMLLAVITAIVAVAVMTVSVAFIHRSVWESLMFALAIAVSLTPQLLPAIVTVSMSIGARRMAEAGVIVKRLVSIEDVGNVQVLFTDKTGTLTQGTTTFASSIDAAGNEAATTSLYGLLCDTTSGNGAGAGASILDRALRGGARPEMLAAASKFTRIAELPFDYERRMTSVLVADGAGPRTVVVKGAPESVLARCVDVPDGARSVLNAHLDSGLRVLAVATRDVPASVAHIELDDERDLHVSGFLLFSDPVKSDAAASLAQLRGLGIAVKILTGDNERVAVSVCAELGLPHDGVLLGERVDAMSDSQLSAALASTAIFARTNPAQKARIVRLQRAMNIDVGYLGDGVNDAGALHEADVGISVESAVDVARDAADIILTTKDLGILASGITQGRKIFANTVKYVLMATSSNFGNMISTAAGSMILPFLPMLPSQVLLNNFLYDISEITIPTDNVDAPQLRRPAHWDMRLIRRFMSVFGPINAGFDFSMFALMLLVLHLSAPAFRTGFFIESFTTQTIVIFALRTRGWMFKSRPSIPLTATTLACAAAGLALPLSPLGAFFGFAGLPISTLAAVLGLIVLYVLIVEGTKRLFFRTENLRQT